MTVLFEPILALHQVFKLTEIIGGGGGAKRYVCPPPNIFIGGGDCHQPPPPPQDRRLWGQATWTSKGGCVQWRTQDLKKGVGGKSVRVAHCVCAKRTARASYGWGPGARRRAPAGGPGGGVPGSSRVFSK